MSNYEAVYEKRFVRNLRRYSSLRQKIKRRVERILSDPYMNTEPLADASGNLNLLGCRSACADRNFRIIFVICEECRDIPECEFCFCEDMPDNTIVFLTVGPHDKAYAMK
ncbi:type II toxin-antitoxin system RelE family toxin [Desulfonema magnum]|uniref:RelE/ParE toxin domain-containing protein n=1 Tax=Desulfonema magnum TaxID=45655 RepID=A0A975BF75_9BACT|nr:hypothetical protein [Desulfonema magnum]QTA84069.1 RelE/ParE toxin domain-containing protein [Desulfonema magnum]